MTLQLERETLADEVGSQSAILLANIPQVGQRIQIRLPYDIYLHLVGGADRAGSPESGLQATDPADFFSTRMSWRYLPSSPSGGQDQCYFESTSHCGPAGEPILYGTSRDSLFQATAGS